MSAKSNTRRLTALVVAVALTVGAFTAPAAVAASPNQKRAAAKQRKALTKRMKAKIRRQLARQLKLNPAAALDPSFAGQAALSDFKMPLTVRLNAPDGNGGFLPSDDRLEIDWDDSTATWPLPDGTMA